MATLRCYLSLPHVEGPHAAVFRALNAACEAALFTVDRVDRTFDHATYWPLLREAIEQCDFAIADFTRPDDGCDPDANVVTEASLARFTHGKPLMIVSSTADATMPLDWADVPVFGYELSEDGLRTLTERLSAELRMVAASLYEARGEPLPDTLAQIMRSAQGAAAPSSKPISQELFELEVPGSDVLSGPTISSDPALRPVSLADTPTPIGTLTGHEGAITSVAVDAEASIAVTGGVDGTVRVWDLDALRERRVIRAGTAPINDVAIAARGRFAVTVAQDKVWRLLSLEDGSQVNWGRHAHGFCRVSALPMRLAGKGVRAIVASHNGQLMKWNCDKGEPIDSWNAHDGPVTAIGLDREGTRVITGGEDGTIRLFETGSARDVLTIGRAHEGTISAVAIDGFGSRAVTAAPDACKLWDISTGEELNRLVEHEGLVTTAVFLPGSKLVITGGTDGRLAIWDARARKLVTTWTAHAGPVCEVAIRGNSDAVSVGEDSRLIVWDLVPTINSLEG